jgi:ACR3 family arsenite transporter
MHSFADQFLDQLYAGCCVFDQNCLRRKRFRLFADSAFQLLLATLVLIFAFLADNITGKSFHVVLIAVPILIQVYFNSSLAYGLMRLFKIEYAVAAPGALIGASNFFELAVATAIALFGPESGAALATVVGVLIEVPVMLSVCSVSNRTRHWFPVAENGSEDRRTKVAVRTLAQ